MWSANRWHSLSALSQFARLAERLDTMSSAVQNVVASAGFSVASSGVPAQALLLSATVGTMGAPFRSPIPCAETCTTTRLSEPARASVAPELSDRLLEEVSDLASECCPPLPSQSLRLSLSGSSTSNPPTGPTWGRGVVAQAR